MVKIYLVRHCEALGNVMGIFQGTTDCDITEKGAVQLEYLKERFKDIHINKAFSSPLLRAVKTAKAVIGERDIPITPMKEFIEVYAGFIEGKDFNETFEKYPELADIWDNNPEDFAPEGAEPMREVYERVWRGINLLAGDPDNEGKTLIVASHGAAIRCLVCRLIYGDIGRLKNTDWSGNTAVTLLNCEEGKITAEYINDTSHLPKEVASTYLRLLTVKED